MLRWKSFQCDPIAETGWLDKILATSLRVFELQPKTRNMLPLFRIRRKSFAMVCYIAPIFVATSYRGRSSEKIVQCDITFRSLSWHTSSRTYLLLTIPFWTVLVQTNHTAIRMTSSSRDIYFHTLSKVLPSKLDWFPSTIGKKNGRLWIFNGPWNLTWST